MDAEPGVRISGPYVAARLRAEPDLSRDIELAERGGFPSVESFLASPDAEYRIAKWEQDNDRCPVHGGSFLECPDDERDWFPQRRICWPSAQLAAANRRFDALHEDQPYHDGSELIWSEKATKLTPFHFRDGVTIYLAPIDENPGDDFLSETVSPSGQ